MYIIIIIFLLLIVLFLPLDKSKTNNSNSTDKEKNIDYKKYYKSKESVMTLNEINFYKILEEIANELNLTVFAQVSLKSIIDTKKDLDYKERQKYFNKISEKSIDFVLISKNDYKIKLCIELDDNTHRQAKRITRDKFINELFESLKIDLLRYPVYKTYYKDALKNKILEKSKEVL